MGPVTLVGNEKNSQLDEIAKQLKIANELKVVELHLIGSLGLSTKGKEELNKIKEKI